MSDTTAKKRDDTLRRPASPERRFEWPRSRFALAMAVLPLGAFGAIVLAPDLGGLLGSDRSASTSFANRPAPVIEEADPGPLSPDELESTQPQYAGSTRGIGRQPVRAREDWPHGQFSICEGPVRQTCVVDGDTIWLKGERIQLAGFDAPEAVNPGCANEARLAGLATKRLQRWLNKGPFSLDPSPDGRIRDEDGRTLSVVSRGGVNVAGEMVSAGLAKRRKGSANSWC